MICRLRTRDSVRGSAIERRGVTLGEVIRLNVCRDTSKPFPINFVKIV